MSGRGIGFLALVIVVAIARCSSSPTAPELAPADNPGTLHSAAHLDTNTVIASITVGDGPDGLAITPELEP